MARIKFKSGEQRKFFKEVLKKLNCPTLRAFEQFGFNIPYSTMKNYFTEDRTISEQFFNELIFLTKLDKKKFHFEILADNFGQKIGGKKSKRK